MASSRMPRLMAWVASVWRSRCGCTPGTPAARPTRETIRPIMCRSSGPRWSATSRLCAADVLQVGRGPGGEQLCELGVQRDVAVVAELAQRDPQPVPGADLDDRVGVEVGQLAGPHAGAGQQLDDEPVAGVGAGPGGGHQPGGVAVAGELGQRLGLFGDVPGDDRVAGRRVGPVPLDDPLEERPDGADPLPVRLGRDRLAAGAGLGSQPYLVVLDVIAAHRGDRRPARRRRSSSGRTGAARSPPRPRCPGRGTRPAAADTGWIVTTTCGAAARICAHCAAAMLPGTAGRGRRGGQRAHRTAACCTASISATAAVSASISSAARRYSPASQSLARCR